MEYKNRVGFRIGILVSESGKTQRDFADRIGVSQPTLNRAIRGDGVTFETLNAIADYYRIPFEYFFIEDDREAECILHPERRVEEEEKQSFLIDEFKNAFQKEQEKNKLLNGKIDSLNKELAELKEANLNVDVKSLALSLLKATGVIIEAL